MRNPFHKGPTALTGTPNRGDFRGLPRLIIALCLVTASPVAWSIDTLTTEDLGKLCIRKDAGSEPHSKECSTYIRGFVDGAVATDPRVALNVTRELAGEETFSERAFRTRLGKRLERFGPSYLAEFCIPGPESLGSIKDHVEAELLSRRERGDMSGSARELVYQVLRQHYPCEVQ